MEHKFLTLLKRTSRWIIFSLMSILMLSMVLGTLDLFVLFFNHVISPDPYPILIKVEDLYSIFSVLLIIIVGYELFKSMYLILDRDDIPVKSILKIAVIALANKVITLNLKDIEIMELFGIAAMIISIGVTYFFFNTDKKIVD